MFRYLTTTVVFGVFLLVGQPGFSQTGSIPNEVIAECNASASASAMPDCLKNGAIAFEMLALARESTFYGDTASRVIVICDEQNETFNKTWICFDNAAEQAVETRKLIGIDSIADACVAAISDADVHKSLADTYSNKRSQRFPDQMYFGGEMYHPFKGCPKEIAAVEEKVAAPAADQSTISPEGCKAYLELEALVADNDADALREMYARVKSLNKPDPADVSDITGLSTAATDFFNDEKDTEGAKDKGAMSAALLGSFLRDSHQELLDEFFEAALAGQASPTDELSKQFVQTIILSMIDAAEEAYLTQCK